MNEIVGTGIVCDRCGELLVKDGVIIQGYSVLEVTDDPSCQHYLCAMCDEMWKTYYLMVGWQIKQEILIIEPN